MYERKTQDEIDEDLDAAAAAEVLGDSQQISDALSMVGAFEGKSARGGFDGTARTWDAWTDADCLDGAGDFNPEAPAGALMFGLLFGVDKTSSRCRYALASRVEKALEGAIVEKRKAMAMRLFRNRLGEEVEA